MFLYVSPLPLQIVLPPHLENIRDRLAENIHELWGMNKIELGWTYGKVNLKSDTKSRLLKPPIDDAGLQILTCKCLSMSSPLRNDSVLSDAEKYYVLGDKSSKSDSFSSADKKKGKT